MNTFRTGEGGLARTQPLRFRFDGQPLKGYAGDTLASALLANGIYLTGRSFKTTGHARKFSAAPDEPNALVAVQRDHARQTPNLRATQLELYDGLQAVSQNRWPSLSFDLGAVNGMAIAVHCRRLLLQDLLRRDFQAGVSRLAGARPRSDTCACRARWSGRWFPGNDHPGILLAGTAGSYLNRYGVLAGRRVGAHRARCAAQTAWICTLPARRMTGVGRCARDDEHLPQAARAAGLSVRGA